MNRKRRDTPQSLFAHSISNNIDFQPGHRRLEAVGAEVIGNDRGHMVINLNHQTHDTRHAQSKTEMADLCKLLEAAVPARRLTSKWRR